MSERTVVSKGTKIFRALSELEPSCMTGSHVNPSFGSGLEALRLGRLISLCHRFTANLNNPSHSAMPNSLGITLKENMIKGLPTRTKDERDYVGIPIPPLNGGNSSSGLVSSPKWLEAEFDSETLFNPCLTLHDEIIKFMNYMKPTPQDAAIREDVIRRFRSLVKLFGVEATVQPFGSYCTGLYLPTSDIDMVLTYTDSQSSLKGLSDLKLILQKIKYSISGKKFASEVEDVLSASVPLIRIMDKKSNIKIDLSAADGHSMKSTNIVLKWLRTGDGEIIKTLTTVLKVFLSTRKCATTYTGGINSYLLLWMVVAWVRIEWRGSRGQTTSMSKGLDSAPVSTLKKLSPVQSFNSRLINPMVLPNNNDSQAYSTSATSSSHQPKATDKYEDNLGEMLLAILKFYGYDFDYHTRAIKIEPRPTIKGKKISYSGRRIKQRYLLSIVDPANASIDMGTKVYGIKHISASFKQAYNALMFTKQKEGQLISRSPGKSLLREILGDFRL